MSRPRLLDLFCCAGGAAMGYFRAGFDVVGIDIAPQPHFPFEFHQADALEYLSAHGHEFDAIHASPPCQAYSRVKGLTRGNYPMLIEPVRNALVSLGKPYVIENVPGAPLRNPTLICGLMLGLSLYRHRLFETSFSLPFVMDYGHGLKQDSMTGPGPRSRDIVLVVGKGQYKGYRIRASAAMGIDWMLEEELAEAIPPAYTEYIGGFLMAELAKKLLNIGTCNP